jgi:uncharacterized protein YcfJ
MRWMVKSMVVLSAAAVAAACGGEQDRGPDRYDLSWMDTLKFDAQPGVASALETGLTAAEPVNGATPAVAAPKPAASRPAARRTTTASSSSSSGTYRAPAPVRTETVRHTARDAAIGAAGGAVIGAVAGGSRHRVKGAVIGAAAGAVVGGVIGHTVDKKERPVYE